MYVVLRRYAASRSRSNNKILYFNLLVANLDCCIAFMHKDLENMQKHHTFAPSKTKLTNEYKSDTYRHKVAVA